MYRLTLVKQWNTDELKSYADLVSLGKPDFLEIKVLVLDHFKLLTLSQGVTYCGSSKASPLTMQNVPWHDEVRDLLPTNADQ